MVTVESRLKQMQVFNLEHEVCCKTKCGCTQEVVTVVKKHPRTGIEGTARVTRRHHDVKTILAREKDIQVSESFLELPAVKNAINARSLRVTSRTASRAPKTKPEPKPSKKSEKGKGE